MASMLFAAKDFVTSKITPDCLKASAEELKNFAKNRKNSTETDGNNQGKITEWEAAWNVTNAIQVYLI